MNVIFHPHDTRGYDHFGCQSVLGYFDPVFTVVQEQEMCYCQVLE